MDLPSNIDESAPLHYVGGAEIVGTSDVVTLLKQEEKENDKRATIEDYNTYPDPTMSEVYAGPVSYKKEEQYY